MAGDESNSVQTVVTSLIVNGVLLIVFVIAFIILRPKNKLVYDPRVYSKSVVPADRPRPLERGYFMWFMDLITRRDSEIIRDAGLDGYFFIRYLRFLFFMSVLGMIVLMPILLPVNATNGFDHSGFDLLAFGNIENENRYFAHALLSWVYYGLVLFFIYREFLFYVGTRQAVLTSESQKYLVSNRTILISDVPTDLSNEEYLKSVFSGVKHVFISRDASDLADAVKDRAKLYNKLEGTETSMLKSALKKYAKAQKKGTATDSPELNDYVKPPTHRLGLFGGKIPFFGKKVETIPYLEEQIPTIDEKIVKLRRSYKDNDKRAAAFIIFNTQYDAEVAAQMIPFHRPLQMSPITIGVSPDEVIWENLNYRWYQRLVYSLGASSFCVALIIFWAIPVAFAGFISQISTLIQLFPWLSFINNLPSVLYGLISSLLPLVILAVLMMLLPIMIRKAAKYAGAPTLTHVEYYTQNVYYAFQVVQVFFMMALSSAILKAIQPILADPKVILSYLQQNLPSSSNIFIAYVELQGMTIPGGMLLQIVAVILYYALGAFLDNTPRKIWARRNSIGGGGWGTVYPIYSLLGLIMFVYGVISPIILPFSAFGFLLIYIAFLNNLMFCSSKTSSRGINYPRGLQHLFVGIYISELVMVVLFVFSKSWGPLVLEVVVFLFTIWFHTHLNSAFSPLLYSLPKSLLEHSPSYADAPSAPPANGAFRTPRQSIENPFQEGASVIKTPTYTSGGDVSQFSTDTKSAVRGYNGSVEKTPLNVGPSEQNKSLSSIPEAESVPEGNIWQRLFKPHIYYAPDVLRRTLLTDSTWNDVPLTVSPEEEYDLFNDPAMTAGEPEAWFPRDPHGWADDQLKNLKAANINAVAEGSWFNVDKKPKIEISDDVEEIPIYGAPKVI